MYLCECFIVLDISSDENIPNKNVFMCILIVLDISSDENIPNKNVFMCILYCIRYF